MNKHGMCGKKNAQKEIKATAQIQIRVTEELKQRIRQCANDRQMTISEFILSAVEQQL